MALVVYDRVRETTTTTGTGTLTLAGAVAGYQSFAVVGNGNTTFYTIIDGNNWEVGIGTYTSVGTTLARTTILANSSGTTSPITLAAGTKTIWCDYPAGQAVFGDAVDTAYSGQYAASNGFYINNKTVSISYSIPSGYSAMSTGPITVNSGITVTVPSGSKWVVL